MKRWIAITAVGLLQVTALGADKPLAWPRFRGPGGTGVAEGQQPPIEIGPEINVKWKIAVPSGISSPIIVGDMLVLTAFDEDKLFTIAYDRNDGRELWRREARTQQIEPFLKGEGSPAASTPATDGQRILVYFGSCGLIAYDLEGNELWTAEMPPPEMGFNFGSGVSPILERGTAILVRDESKGSKIVAFDAATGKQRWQTDRKSPVSYCTPVLWETRQGRQIAAAGHGRLVGYDFETGKEAWSVLGMPTGCCSSPVALGDTLYFAGWSPGGADDKDFHMPTFDDLLKNSGDADKDGKLSREESQTTDLKDFFDANDGNKDGFITRDEWDAILKYMSEGKNSAFALKAGGQGDISETHVVWKKVRGLPYIPSAIVYRDQVVMVKDGGIVTAYDSKTGREIYMERAAASGSYYASPVAANGHIYFTSLADGAITVIKAGEAKPVVAASNPPLGERVSATPAIAGNTFFVRTDKHLYAFAEKP